MRRRALGNVLALGCLLGLVCGVAGPVEQDETQATLTAALTAPEAKRALLQMLESVAKTNQHFGQFNLGAFVRQRIQQQANGVCWFEGFRIDLRQARYDIHIGYYCRFHYRGSFEQRAGRWVTTPPQWMSVACRKD